MEKLKNIGVTNGLMIKIQNMGEAKVADRTPNSMSSGSVTYHPCQWL